MNEEIVTLVGSVGFPIAMCFWFMYRTEGVIKSNTEALTALTTKINYGGKNET